MIFESYRLDMVSRGIKPHSLLTYDRVARLFQEWTAGQDLRLEDVKPGHVQLFLQQTGWAPRTQRTALCYLRAAYGYSVDMLEILERNPCKKVKLQRPEQKVPRTIPNRVLREVRAGVRDDKDALTLALFMWTGMRSIEVRRLQWWDVRFEENVMLANGKGDRQRLVPIHPELRKLLLRAQGEKFHYVCPGRGGNAITTAGLHYRMKRIVGPDVQNHDFRRTVATSLRANRVDPYVRDAIMGWTRDEMFSAHYNAVSREELMDGILVLYQNDPV